MTAVSLYDKASRASTMNDLWLSHLRHYRLEVSSDV